MAQPFYIAFDESHKPRGRVTGNYSQLKNILESEGFVCQSFMEFPIMRSNLAPYDILVVPCPDFSKFSRDEIDAITTWVREDGGGLVMLGHAGGDKGRRSNLSELAEKFGMSFENDQIIDKKHNYGHENHPEVKNFTQHPISEGITSICFRSGCSLTTNGLSVSPIGISSEDSEPFSSPLIVANENEEGRIVGIGSYEMFRNKISGGIDQDQHIQFALNVFNWLKTDYRTKLKSGEVKPKVNFKVPIPSSQSYPSASINDSNGTAGNPVVSPSGFTPMNIQSNIQISDKSDLANLLYALLNEADVLKQQIQNIINAVVASEEKILELNKPPLIPMEQHEDEVFQAVESEETEEEFQQVFESENLIEENIEQSKGMLDLPETPMSPKPLKPPSLLNLPDVPMTAPPAKPSRKKTKTKTPPPEKPKGKKKSPPKKVTKKSSKKAKPKGPQLPPAEIQAELDTLQSKLSSIEDLKAMVEKKFNEKKYTKKQFDKQMNMLNNDKKKALFRVEELKLMKKKKK
ncbi:MAG: hypothetical protein GY870_17040 [archaeon]|nr:hypothetical protein [archaeon]